MWFHMVMCFGAAASVWNFNRTADTLQALKRVLLWTVSGRFGFVDDFNGVDIDELAAGAFDGMAGFLDLLSLQTKPSKAQNAKERIQGRPCVDPWRRGGTTTHSGEDQEDPDHHRRRGDEKRHGTPCVANRLAGRLITSSLSPLWEYLGPSGRRCCSPFTPETPGCR